MSDDNQEAIDTADATERADQPKACANCGEHIDLTEWHPVATRDDDEDGFRMYAFCDGDCRDEWIDD